MPFIRATEIKNGEILTQNILHVAANQGPKMQKCLVSPGEMVLVRSGVNTGDCAIVPSSLAGSYAAYDLILRFTNAVNPSFVSAFLDTEVGRTQLNILKARSAQPHLNAEEVSSILLPLPPPDIQGQLVAEMQAARAARQAALAQADALLSGLDAYLLNELGLTAPQEDKRQTYAMSLKEIKGKRCDALYYAPHFYQLDASLKASPYPKKLLGAIAPDPVGGATPSRSDAALYAESGIKFLRILNVTPNEIRMEDVKFIQESVHEGELRRSQLQANDVLMTITGRVGTAAVVTEEILPANINQHIVRMRVKDEDCLPEYLAVYLNSSMGLGLSNRSVTGGTRIALDYEAIKTIEIPIPPPAMQEKIAVEVASRREKARDLRAQAAEKWEAAKAGFERQLLGEEPLP